MRLSITGKIILLVAVAVVLSCSAVLFTTMHLMRPPLAESLSAVTHLSQVLADQVYHLNAVKFQEQAKLISGNTELVRAVMERDQATAAAIGKSLMRTTGSEFITITDARGIVVGRGHSPKYGDDVNNQATVAAGRRGEATAGIVAGTVVPFTLRAGAPLLHEGKVVGTVGIGLSLTSPTYVDQLKRSTGLEMTIFKGDVRVMTTLTRNGKRLVGTRLENREVTDAVLGRREMVSREMDLLGKPFRVVYWPILNMDNQPVGMWFTGQPQENIVAAQQTAVRNALGATLGIAAFFALLAFLTGSRLAAPIKHITAFAVAVARGALDTPLEVRTRDETGTLADALRTMVRTLKQRIAETREQSELARTETDKAHRAMEEAEQARHAADNARREGMLAAAGQLENVVEIISSASAELSAQIRQSERGAVEQAARAADTVSAMDEMARTVTDVARNADTASDVSADTRRKADSGAAIVEQAVNGIRGVRQESLLLKKDMTVLAEQARDVSTILNVISDIADQTNLLALNAAIEAARAGEAGRGFAVVADEVRKLAEKTMASTTDVDKALRNIQQSADQSMRQVDKAVVSIEEATTLANSSGEALREIVSMADATADQVRGIAAASAQQSATSEKISHSITQVNTIAGETARAMEEAAHAVSDLANQAQVLTGLIDNMKRG